MVSTLTVLTGAASEADLSTVLHTIFTPVSSISFLTFTVLYMPCVAAFAATKRELGSLRAAAATAAYQTGMAYLAGFVVFQFGQLFFG